MIMKRTICCILILSALLVGCLESQSSSTGKQTEDNQPMMTASAVRTIFIDPSVTSTVRVQQPTVTTIHPRSTYTPFPPTLAKTTTPIPTLEPQEAKKLVEELLIHNNGCRYPCWWGITPGVMSWPEAYQFLAPFTHIEPNPELNKYGVAPKIAHYLVTYPLDNMRGRGGFTISASNNRIAHIRVDYFSTKYSSLLHQILTQYGRPSQVYISTDTSVPDGGRIPFILVLDYSENNFAVFYQMLADVVDDEVVSCPAGESPSLWLWAKDEVVTEHMILEWASGIDPYLPTLEEVTDLNLSSFTEIYSTDDGQEDCLRTNTNYW